MPQGSSGRLCSLDGDEVARWLLEPAPGRAGAWPHGAIHEGAMRLALASVLRTAIIRAERGDSGWDRALDDITERADTARLQHLLTAVLQSLEALGASPSTVALLHLQIASAALARGDRLEAESHFASALALEEGDSIAALGLQDVRRSL